jgi:hypothetical protein
MRLSLRSSPILCALDTVILVVKIVSLHYAGCSWRTACHQVWWDRFPEEEDKEHSGLEGSWALNMWAFILGALPQAIKIYGMRGIPLTQALATIFLLSFVTIEVIRLTAGPLGHEKPMTTPAMETTKRRSAVITFVLAVTGELSQLIVWNLIFPSIIPDQPFWWPSNDAAVIVLLMASTFLFTIFAVATPLITFDRWSDIVTDLIRSYEDAQLQDIVDGDTQVGGINNDRSHRSSIELVEFSSRGDRHEQTSESGNTADAVHPVERTTEEIAEFPTEVALSPEISHQKVHQDESHGTNCPDLQ